MFKSVNIHASGSSVNLTFKLIDVESVSVVSSQTGLKVGRVLSVN